MKFTLIVPALIAAGTLGCADSTALNQIHIGMTRAEIISLLGQPDSTSAQANIEYLTYYLMANSSTYERELPYFVRLVDGKVESFGRFASMYDLQNRPVNNGSTTSAPVAAYPMAPTPAPAAGAAPTADIASQLLRLKQLHDQGVLTDDEFARAKAKVLGGGN
jgi:hypothetical protein